MRIASRVVGVLLALAGLAFLVLFVFLVTFGFERQSVLSGPDRTSWITGSVLMVAGVGFILAGRHFLKLDVDQVGSSPDSRFAPFFIAHRGQVKIVAQAGLVISMIRLGAASFGADWPGPRAAFPLFLVSIGLLVIASQMAKEGAPNRLDWERVPERMRPVLRVIWKAVGPGLWILILLLGWNELRHQVFSPVVNAGFIVLLFAWAALFFQYGKLRADD
jgi:hypothetical protein